MNNLKTFLLLFVFAFFISACGEDTENNSNDAEEEVDEEEEVVDTPQKEDAPVICLWSAVSIRETPGPKGKWVTTINLGETGKYLGESVMDSTNKNKPREFIKIELSDGTTGWIQASFMAIDAEPFALKEGSKLYKRPDILTASKNEFDRMQYVVVLEEKDDWVKVKGKKRTDGWFKSGWVKKDHLTDNEIDINVAILADRALGKGDDEKKAEALNEILENSDLNTSIFTEDVRKMVDDLSAPEEEEVPTEEEVYEDYGD